MKQFFKQISALLLSAMLVLSVISLIPAKADAAAQPKLSKTKLTFASPKAKAQTITLKNIKASQIKSVRINNQYKDQVTVKKISNVKFSVKPKLAGEVTSIVINVKYKKNINGMTEGFFYLQNIKVKGHSDIAIKSAAQLMNMRSYTKKYWTYYLAKDIDLTGKGYVQDKYKNAGYTDFVLDGKGHTIKSDTPIFKSNAGTIKNIVFDVNMKCQVSKKDAITKIWGGEPSNSTQGGVGPIMDNTYGKVIGCKSIGKIEIIYDKPVTWTPYGGSASDASPIAEAFVGGLVAFNGYGSIKQCSSDVKITFKSTVDLAPSVYIGGITGRTSNMEPYNTGTVTECVNTGNIQYSSNSFAYGGGICGDCHGYITDCLNTGSVKNTGNFQVNGAGILGTSGGNGKIKNVLNTGDVNAGLYGNQGFGEDPKFTNAYWLSSKSAGFFNVLQQAVEVPGTKGITGEELTSQATFSGFDFNKIWKMGATGPELKNVP